MQDEVVRCHLQMLSSSGNWTSVGNKPVFTDVICIFGFIINLCDNILTTVISCYRNKSRVCYR